MRNIQGGKDKISKISESRGTDTALLEVWHSVLEDIDGTKIVAMCLLDVSDGFGSVPHTNMFRKLETYGYEKSSLEWFASYLGEENSML